MSNVTFSVESSAGRLRVEFGWGGWTAVTLPRSNGTSHAARRILGARRDLEELLLACGLPAAEAATLAAELWRRRPGDASQKDPGEEPAYDRGLVLLVGLLALAAGLVLLASTTGIL